MESEIDGLPDTIDFYTESDNSIISIYISNSVWTSSEKIKFEKVNSLGDLKKCASNGCYYGPDSEKKYTFIVKNYY